MQEAQQWPTDPHACAFAGDARAWLAAIADSSDDAIVGKDLNGIVTSWNSAAEAMFGFSYAEMVGRPITDIIPPDRLDEEQEILARMRRNERIVHFETERKRRDGSVFPVSITVSPIRDEQNRVIGISKIARDLSERDRYQSELSTANAALERLAQHLAEARDTAEQASRAKSRFVASMSHELRTPLNGILGYAELLHLEGDLNATQVARVAAMRAAGKHLLELINGVLDLSEIEAGRLELNLAECDVPAIGSACLDLVRPFADAKDLTLNITVSPGTRHCIVSDPMRLRQVLFNLLGNAAKFTSQGGIELRLRNVDDGCGLRIEVIDTGPGISASYRERLFQEFDRLGSAGTIEGTGLGLALSARLTTLLGGRLGYDDNPGGGSVFWLELPVDNTAPPAPVSAPTYEAADAEVMPTGCLDVLVVDDIAINRDIAGSFLRAAGHSVTCVEGGAQAIAAVSDGAFDVVLMDVRMPEMDGLEATRRIRALEGARGQLPIVALTAQAFTGQVAKCYEAGVNGHLAKPFTPAGLLGAIGRAVRNARGSARLAPAECITEVDLLLVNPSVLDRAAGFLPPGMLASYFRTIVDKAETLLRDLCETDALTQDGDRLAETAHGLAGSAGLVGLDRLAALGRRFESAVQTGSADIEAIANALCTAIEATIHALQDPGWLPHPEGGPADGDQGHAPTGATAKPAG